MKALIEARYVYRSLEGHELPLRGASANSALVRPNTTVIDKSLVLFPAVSVP
jgi:hypothetical protein